MKENEKIMPVDYDSIKMEIFKRANEYGPLKDIKSWKAAFPEIDFMEVDESFSGEKIDWEKRTMAERAFYVAYMNSPQDAEIKMQIAIEGMNLYKNIKDSEKIWWMWMAGCFSGDELDEKALRTFMAFTDDSQLAQKYLEEVDLDEVEVVSLKAMVAPL